MACVALASLMSTIELEFLQPFRRVFHHHQPPIIQSFFDTISSLQAFVQESSGGGGAIKDLEIQIRDFALNAEDNIEIQLSNFVLAKDREDQEKASHDLHQALQEAAENASELLNIINETHQPSSIIHSLKHASCRSGNEKWDGSSRRFPKLVVSRMVGRHHDREVIIKRLSSDPSYLMLIPIVGMLGIGKTTLAKSVYGDPQVINSFNICRWITVPQECNKRQILGLLLQSFSPSPENKIGNDGATDEELVVEVRRHLSGKRYLIVFDNIQDHRVLKSIRLCFPGNNGSRILLTTTYFNLNKYIKRYSCTKVHNMALLDSHECWDLFCSVFPRNKECMAHKLEKIRSDIVETCDGLPWSIAVVAKRLSKWRNILKGWEKIKKETETLGILDHNALIPNYNQLPQHLKVCFLYFGVFPKRKEVLVKMLIRLWIGEGFVKPVSLVYPEVENQAYAYLEELIARSLVLICSEDYDGKIKSCRMHSALHCFCVGEAQKEGIFCGVNTLQHTALSLSEFANSSRWLSLYTHSFDYYVLSSTNKPRSIFFFDDDPKTFVPFKLLRVLAFVPSPFLQRVSMHSRYLIFLRYLFVSQRFEGLGNIVSNNPNLHTVIVSSDEPKIGAPTNPTIHLSSTIWELPHLRHLELGDIYTIDDLASLATMTNLQTLSLVSPTHCGREVHFNFPSIKKVKLFYKEGLVPNDIDSSSSNSITLYNLDYLKLLERLTISISIGCIVTLPERYIFPSQLKKLNLSGAILSQRDLTTIGMLPELRVFKLENALLGSVWKIAEGEFRELRFLLIEDKKLKQLQSVETYTLLHLKRLVLRCYCLEDIPLSFGGPNLKHIELDGCSNPSIAKSAWLLIFDKGLYDVELITDRPAVNK